MAAYGKSISPDDSESIPSWYANVVDVVDDDGNPILDEQGNPLKDLEYANYGAAWKASSLHQIFSAYGLELPIVSVEAMPRNFAKVVEKEVEGEKVNEVELGSSHVLWSGRSLAQILYAYN